MEPIPVFYEFIDRNAIVVKGKKPFMDWINSVFPDNRLTVFEDGNIYLVGEKDDNDQVKKWLQKNFDKIFQNELNDWCTDPDEWPKKRTFNLFKEWFEFEIHGMVLDIEDKQIFKK